MTIPSRLLLFVLFTLSASVVTGQSDTLSRKEIRKEKKQLKIEQGKPLLTPLAGLANWLPNGVLGYRLEVQPRMNLRIDFGFGRETMGFYFNFNEAF